MSGCNGVSYVEEHGHFRIDLSGRIDAQSLASRHAELLDSLRRHLAPDQAIRLLFDTRGAQFDSPGVHLMMRELFDRSSGEFCEHPAFAAILNPHRSGSPAPGEAFFTDETEALRWLAWA